MIIENNCFTIIIYIYEMKMYAFISNLGNKRQILPHPIDVTI